jgi:hypothetical protein
MVRTVTRKTPNTKTTWHRLGKSANTGIKRSSSSRRKELVKLKSMKKVTKRVLEEKLKRAYLKDGLSKECPPGKTLSRKGNCVKIWPRSPRRKSLNSGYELNRKTGRLRKVCPSGKKRSRKGRCVNKK